MVDSEIQDSDIVALRDRVKKRGHDLGYWLVVMNTHFNANTGLVMRVASNFGASELVVIGQGRFRRAASVGTASSVPIRHFDTAEEAAAWFAAQGIELVAAELTNRSTPIHQAQWPTRVALVIGDERDGVPRALLEAALVVVEIPMYGLAGSMNMGLAAGILAYEHVRRLGFPELEPLAPGGRRCGWLTHPNLPGGKPEER